MNEYTIQFGEVVEGVSTNLWQEKVYAASVEKAEGAMTAKKNAIIGGNGYNGAGVFTAALV